MIDRPAVIVMASAAAPAAGDARRKTACVTGGSGYIASELIKMLLQNGYAVKTTVRHPGQIYILDLDSVQRDQLIAVKLQFLWFDDLDLDL